MDFVEKVLAALRALGPTGWGLVLTAIGLLVTSALTFIGLYLTYLGLGQAQRHFATKRRDELDKDRVLEDRELVLNKVRREWVERWLERDLYRQARIELKLTARDDAVVQRVRRYTTGPNETPVDIPPGTPIEQTFDRASRKLLILGEPGTGKSTKLVELAQALLVQAEEDVSKPIPMIFNLSTWTKKGGKIERWIQAEMVSLYGFSIQGAKQWTDQNAVLPLLDGLDEVAADRQADCITAINTYRQNRGSQPLAVCCRVREYKRLLASQSPLDLDNAIEVQELTRPDVERYLDEPYPELQRVRRALDEDPGLWDLMNTPLMLTVLFLASGVQAEENEEDDPRKRLYKRFVRDRFERPRARNFSKGKTLKWLGWLAAELFNRDRISFALEDLDLTWLSSRRVRFSIRLVAWLFVLLFVLLVVGLVIEMHLWLLVLVLIVGESVGSLAFGLLGGLILWLFGTAVSSLLTPSRNPQPVDDLRFDWHRLPAGLAFGLVGGLLVGLGGWLFNGVFTGVFGVLIVGLVFVLEHALQPASVSQRSTANEGTSRSLRYALSFLASGTALLWTIVALAYFMCVRFGAEPPEAGEAWVVVWAAPPLFIVPALSKGGFFVIRHGVVRVMLQRLDLAPRAYVRFLDEAADQLFLRKTGGAYQFFHVTFRDFVAETYGAEWLAKNRDPEDV